MRKEGSIHSYGAESPKSERKHIDPEQMKKAQKEFKDQGIYKASESLENVTKRRFAIIAEIKKSLPELKNSEAIKAFDDGLEQTPGVWEAFSKARTQEDIDAIATGIVTKLESQTRIEVPNVQLVGETSPDEILEMPADEDEEIPELDDTAIEQINEPAPQKAQVGTAYGGHVAEALARGESMEKIKQERNQENKQEQTTLATVDKKTARQKLIENALKIAKTKVENGLIDINDLKDSLEGELEEMDAMIEELEDDEVVSLESAINKAEAIRAQLKWIESQKEAAV